MRFRFRKACSFTLIELMVVVSLIGLLAGILLAAVGGVRNQAARNQAKSEVAAIEAGLARYQMEFGDYPVATNISTSGGQYSPSPTNSTYVASGGAGQILFTNLWGATTFNAIAPGRRGYLNVKPSMVNTSGVNYFIDPWGFAYGYYWNGTNSLFGGGAPDVWSTGGQSGSSSQTNRSKWISSWVN